MKTTFTIEHNEDEAKRLRDFRWEIDNKNNAHLRWEWPENRTVKLLFIYEITENLNIPLQLETLLQNYTHSVVTRDLASKFTKILTTATKFIAAAGCFNHKKGITLYTPVYETLPLYRRITIKAQTIVKQIALSNYQKVTIRISTDETPCMPIPEILRYAIFEDGHKIGEYPIDAIMCSGVTSLITKKNQTIKFILDERYLHLFQLGGL